MPSCGNARAISADSRGRSEAGAAPSRCAAAASWAWPRSTDGSGWSGRWIKKLAVMIRCSATIEATTSAAICPLIRFRLKKPVSCHDQLLAAVTASTLGVNI